MTIQLAYQRLLAQLYEVYDSREAANIADMVIEQVTGQRKIDRIVYKDIPVSEKQEKQLERLADELLNHRPVQYVLGEAWFIDMKFAVNEHVLIPRPETEELVQWMLDDLKKAGSRNVSVIDIGTGSGCIPVALKKKIPESMVSAIDVSDEALQIAELNSTQSGAPVDFFKVDFLNENEWNQLGKYDIIVSNPPYIRKSEAVDMRDNILKFEPHIALFVQDEDPFIFYEAIAKFGRIHLKAHGSVYVEINEAWGEQVAEVFRKNDFLNVILKKDMQGRDRMIKASRSDQAKAEASS